MKLTLPYPPSANRYWRHNRGIIHLSSEAKEYRQMVKILGHRENPITGRVRLTAKVFRPRKSGDLMNREKVLCDALQGVAYHDDKQIWEAHFFLSDDKSNPRVEVEVEALEQFLIEV